MGTSVFIARILGPYLIIVGLGVLFNLKTYKNVLEDFCKNTALLYIGGIIALLFGLLILSVHNLWAADWTVIITIFGWLGLIKGAWIFILPDTVSKVTAAIQKNMALLTFNLFIILALGILLTVKGYFCI